ncbi:MAG: LytTR family transcriptional regulator DNA-binding domain-containing protein [Paludibacteraceae bacterium]
MAGISRAITYDKNGNLTTDLDRDMVTIQYNLLNLPELVQFKNGNQLRNTYDASGQKLSERVVTLHEGIYNPLNSGQIMDGLDVNELDMVTIQGTDYIGNFGLIWIKVKILFSGFIDSSKGRFSYPSTIFSFQIHSNEFIRVHRSYIVSLRHISEVRNQKISIANRQITVSTNYEKNFFRAFQSS